jgi:hypothetical protein
MAAMTNHSFYGADRQTHRRVVLVGMAAAMLVSARIAGVSSGTASRAQWAKPGRVTLVQLAKANACFTHDAAVLY